MSITNPNQGASKPLLVAASDGCTSYNLVVDAAAAAAASASAAAYLHSKSAQGPKRFSGLVKYKECLKNHAAAIGGSATDGCGEFMAGGEEGTLEALKCSACNCHRNFHRKIHLQQQQQVVVEPAAPPTELVRIKSIYEGGQGEGKKRFRTKFDQEQKEKMLRFAEKAGWTMHKADEAEVRSLCQEIGVKRKVLKVWMHNNKHQFANKTT